MSDEERIERAKTNSAKRLHGFLTKLRSTDGTNLMTVLPKVLQASLLSRMVDANWQAIQAIGLVGQMLSDVEREVCDSPLRGDELGFYMEFLPGICAAFSPATFNHPWSDIRAKISEADLIRIAHVDMTLRRFVVEETVEEQKLDDILRAVNEALEVLEGSRIPSQMEYTISFHLVALRTAIEQYQYRGVIGIEQAFAGYCGTLVINRPIIEENLSPEGKTKLFNLINVANGFINLAKGVAWAWPHLVSLASNLASLRKL